MYKCECDAHHAYVSVEVGDKSEGAKITSECDGFNYNYMKWVASVQATDNNNNNREK